MVRCSFSNRRSAKVNRRKSLICNTSALRLSRFETVKCAMLSRHNEGVSALLSQRLCGLTFSEISVCVLLKSSANANRRPVDYFPDSTEQRHCFRVLALLDFPG